MTGEDSKALKFSTVILTLLSVFFITTRITGLRILDEPFELFCIHIPALASIILYILTRYLQLKVEA